MSADVLVLGSGLDGLAAAATLARSGKRVLVLEERAALGGTASRTEFHPGFRTNGLLPDAALARRELLRDLELESHGLRWRADEPALLVPHASGCPLFFRRDPAGMDGELPPAERARLEALAGLAARIAPVLAGVVDEPPPDVREPSAGELLGLATKALRLRRLGRGEMLALARILPSPAWDWMDEAVTMDATRVALVAPALAGTVLGPRAPGTSAFVLLRHALAGAEPVGGPAMLAEALVTACSAHGVDFRMDARIRGLALGPEGVRGVELAGGETVTADAVLSTLPPARTLLELLPPAVLPHGVERAVQSFRARGATAVLRLALAQPPVFAGREGEPVERALGFTGTASLLALERASDALKYGALPAEPWVEVRVPSRADASLAPAGKAVAIVACHTVPHDLAGGWTEARRAEFERGMLAAFEALAPGTGASVLGKELLTPADVAARHGTAGGHVFDGEVALDQLWLQRPCLALARYATPLRNLFLGGAASHPGGPFLGGAGVLAARALLARQ